MSNEGCKFCIDKESIKEYPFKLTVDFRNKLEIERTIQMRESVCYEWSYFDIEFCPKCGRELK